MSKNFSAPPMNFFRGFTMVEILVSIMVFSLGLLGIARLQASTSVYKMNSWTINATSLLAGDFADSVRSNPSAAGAAFLDSSPITKEYEFKTTNYTNQNTLPPKNSLTKNCFTTTTPCTPSERAKFDILYWRYKVRDLLPQGSAWVVGNRAEGFNVTLMWQDKDYVNAASSTLPAISSPLCENLQNTASPQQRASCCPQNAQAPAGVRCQNFFFLP
jgi:type IV pilus assembly protein PilV